MELKKKQFKKINGKKQESTAAWSPLNGVQRLELNKLHLFPIIKSQLHDVLTGEFGEQADFVIGQPAVEPDKPDMLTIRREFPGLSEDEARSLYVKAAEKAYLKQEKYKENYQKMFGKVMQVCDQNVKDRLFRLPDFTDVRAGHDCIRLWEMISSVVGDDGTELDLEERKFRASMKFTNERMGPNESLLNFYNRFKLRYDNCVTLDVPGFSDESVAARHFYAKLDAARYGQLYREKMNSVSRKIDEWPATLVDAYTEIDRWIGPRASDGIQRKPVAFTVKQTSDEQDPKSKYPCHKCGQVGHWRKDCPMGSDVESRKQETVKDESGRNHHEKNKSKNKKKKKAVHFSNLTVEEAYSDFDIGSNIFTLSTVAFRGGKIPSLPSNLVIFDSGADVHVANNRSLFTPRDPPEFSKVIGIEGKEITAEVGDMLNLGKCLYIPECPVSLVSPHGLEQVGNIEYVRDVGFVVHVPDYKPLHFSKDEYNGLYVCNMSDYVNIWKGRGGNAYFMQGTINERLRELSRRQRDGVEKVAKLHKSLGYPSTSDMMYAIRNGTILNCPITPDDVKRYWMVYERNIAEIKGKMTKPGNIKQDVITVPKTTDKYLDLHVDIMYVNNIAFLLSVAKPINLLLCTELLNGRNMNNLSDTLLSQIGIIKSQGFIVSKIFVDEERGLVACRAPLADNGIEMVVVTTGQHVNVAERAIRVVKERMRSITSDLPWKLPISFTKWLAYYVCVRINSLPRIGSGVGTSSARELFRGVKLDYNQDMCLSFGDYVQAHRDNAKTNSLEPRSVGAIALCPKDNYSRSWIFMDLMTGKVFSSSKWQSLPINDIAIWRLNDFDKMVADERMRTEEPPPPLIDLTEQRETNVIEESIPQINTKGIENDYGFNNSDIDIDDNDNDIMDQLNNDMSVIDEFHDDNMNNTTIGVDNIDDTCEIVNDNNLSNIDNLGTIYVDGMRRSSRLEKNHSVNNLSVRKATKEYGNDAEIAVAKEIQQMLDKGVFEYVDKVPKGAEVLRSHMFIKMKSNGTLKARLVAGGNDMDRAIYGKDARSSPTVHLENLLMQIGYAATHDMSLCSMDVEGAFLEADLPYPIYMRLSDDVSEVLKKMEPTTYGTKKHVVVKLKKALYGLVTSSKLWYEKLKSVLLSIGLTIHPYDPCVFIGHYKDKYIILSCYVDDILLCCNRNDLYMEKMQEAHLQYTWKIYSCKLDMLQLMICHYAAWMWKVHS